MTEMDDDIDILAALVDEDLDELEKELGSSLPAETERNGAVDCGQVSSDAKDHTAREAPEAQASEKPGMSLPTSEKHMELPEASPQDVPVQPSTSKADHEDDRRNDPRQEESQPRPTVTDEHTGLTDCSSDDDEYLNSTGKEVNTIMRRREMEKRKRENPFEPAMSAREQEGWTKAKVKETSEKNAEVQTDPFSGIRVRNPVISSEALRVKMSGRKMIKIASVAPYLHRMKNQEEDWVTIGVVVGRSDPKSSSKSGKLFSIIKLGDLKNLETAVQLFLFGEVHIELWQKLREGRVVGLLNPKALPHREGSQDTAVTIDYSGKLLEVGDAQDFALCQGRTRNGQKCRNVVNKSQCTFCIYHVKAEFNKMSSMRPEIQSSYSGADPNRLRKAVFESTGGVYGVPKGMTSAESRAAVRPRGSTNAERKQKETLILQSLSLKRKAESELESLTKRKPGTPQEPKDPTAEFMEERLKYQGPGARCMRIALGKETPPSHVQKHQNGIVTSNISTGYLSPSEMLRQHAARKQLLARTPVLSGSPGGTIDLLSTARSPKTSKDKAIDLLRKKGVSLRGDDPNAVRKSVDKEKILKKIEQNSPGTQKKEDNGNKSSPASNSKPSKRMVLGREVDDEEVKKLLSVKSKHQHEIDEVEDEAKAAYFSKLEKKEALEQKMLSIMSVKVKVVSCAVCNYTAITASELCQKEGHPTKTHDATKRFFQCHDCKNRTVSFSKLPSKPCRRCGASSWDRVAMWSERQGPKMDYEILKLRGEEKKFIDSI